MGRRTPRLLESSSLLQWRSNLPSPPHWDKWTSPCCCGPARSSASYLQGETYLHLLRWSLLTGGLYRFYIWSKIIHYKKNHLNRCFSTFLSSSFCTIKSNSLLNILNYDVIYEATKNKSLHSVMIYKSLRSQRKSRSIQRGSAVC